MLFLEKLKQKILNKKINSSSDIQTELSLKTIAEIPLIENKNVVKLVAHENEKSVALKAFKDLRTNIQFLCVNNNEDKKVMLVTSPTGEEGKSFVTANLAVSFAEIGKKVLIIDGNIKKGKQDKIFNIPNDLGLSNYLSNLDSNGVEINEFLSKFIKETEVRNVNIITSGTVPPNSAELLALAKLEELIKDAKVFFDIIIIDSDKVLKETEALILNRVATSVILVANYKTTTVEDLYNAKKDIQNIGGKILGVVLNKVKLKKEKKTKEQRKEDFIKFKLRVKEKINETIECIKRKIQESNQKLLEETNKKIENIKLEDAKTTDNIEEKVETNNKVISEKTEDSEIQEEKVIKEKNQKNFVEFVKNFISQEKNEEIKEDKENVETQEKCEESEIEDVKEKQKEKRKSKKYKNQEAETENATQEVEVKSEIQENEPEKQDNQENEIGKTKFSEFKTSAIEKINNLKQVTTNKFGNAKTAISEKAKTLKENTIDIYLKSKEYCIQKYNDLRKTDIDEENNNSIQNEINQEDINQETNVTQIEVLEEEKQKEEIIDDSIKNEKTILVVVDAENGYCRVFSKEYFSEKLIRGIDKKTGYSRVHYSQKNIRSKQEYFIDRYQLTEAQAERIDVIIYDILKEYDEYLWVERKIPSDKAENYALCMSKDYEFNPDESDKEHTVRSQRLRKIELANIDLDIEYNLDNLWKTRKIKLTDKIQLNKFAKFYEIDSEMKNDSEIMKSNNTKKFYSDIIKGAEKRLEKANKEAEKKEEKEKQAIEEDKKIKQEELKLEQQQFEMEKRAAQERIKIEQENVKAEKKAEQERLKEEKRKEREIERIERKEENIRKKKEKQKQREEAKFQKEREKQKQMEEAKLEEDIMEDNLYPKTKHNKNL